MERTKPFGWPDLNKPGEVFDFDPYSAKLYKVQDLADGDYAGILLEKTYTGGDGVERTKSLMLDVDRLDDLVKRTERFERQPGTYHLQPDGENPDRVEKLGPYKIKQDVSESYVANLHRWENSHGVKKVLVKLSRTELDQQVDPPIVRTDDLWCDLDGLQKIRNAVEGFEKRQGLEAQHYSVLRSQGLADQEGYVRTFVAKSGKKMDAEMVLANYSEGVWDPRPTRRPRPRGEILIVNENEVPEIGPDLRYHEAERWRNGPDYLIAVWNEKGLEPRPGTQVKWDVGQDPTTREPRDYRATPIGVERPQGPDDEPIYLLIKKDNENHPPRHEIAVASRDLEHIVEKKRELEPEMALRMNPNHETEPERNHAVDLSQGDLPGGFRR